MYIISPLRSQLRMSSRKLAIKYVGPLLVYKIIDPHNYILCYVMQAVVSASCLGDKCLSHAKLMSTALTQLCIFRFSCLLTNKGIAQCIDNSN